MSRNRVPEGAENSLTHDVLQAARYYLGRPLGLLVVAGLVLIAAATLNWSWLVAAGIAPILLGVLPCLFMCAFVCMNKSGGPSCAKTGSAADGQTPTGPAGAGEPMLDVPAAEHVHVPHTATSERATTDPQPQPNERKE